jgi:hypothetical protein
MAYAVTETWQGNYVDYTNTPATFTRLEDAQKYKHQLEEIYKPKNIFYGLEPIWVNPRHRKNHILTELSIEPKFKSQLLSESLKRLK